MLLHVYKESFMALNEYCFLISKVMGLSTSPIAETSGALITVTIRSRVICLALESQLHFMMRTSISSLLSYLKPLHINPFSFH